MRGPGLLPLLRFEGHPCSFPICFRECYPCSFLVLFSFPPHKALSLHSYSWRFFWSFVFAVGAICRGGDSFEPKVPGTLWRVEFFASETAWLYRIQWAPPGYIMIRGESPVDDQTVSCGAGWYALEPGIPGGDVMFKPNLAAEVPEDRLCLKCPKGAILFSFPPSNVPLPL